MRKRWIATGLAGALILGGSGMAYQAYAEQVVEGQGIEVQEAIVADTSERVPEIQVEKKDVLQAKDSGETVPAFRESANLETSIEEPLLEPDPAVQQCNVDPASTYKEPVRHIEISGYAAVAVNGEYRRVVHVLIDDQLFGFMCWDVSAEELIAIAKQVVTRS